MKTFVLYLYELVLALWVGGVVIFTFVVTPRIFSHYDRDMAGDIVGTLFPVYFPYNLLLSMLTVALLFFMWKWGATHAQRISLVLAIIAVGINLFVMLKLHPDILEIKRQVASFITTPEDAPTRAAFRRLHAVSAILNLLLLGLGAALMYLARPLSK